MHFDALRTRLVMWPLFFFDAGGAFNTGIAIFLNAAIMLGTFSRLSSMRSVADSLRDQAQNLIGGYSGTRVDVSRNRSVQVEATPRERRPCTKLNRIQLL
jgi:hypothetical protein